jgi:mannose-6-phosphate isomerase-like protein (cupin superfamily)
MKEVIVPKVWGSERWLHNGPDYCMKQLFLESGMQSSLHMHKIKRETFLVIFGTIDLEYDGIVHRLTVGNYIDIEPLKYHRFRTLSKVALVVEASTTHDDADVYRKEESGPWTNKQKQQDVG